uniref:7TM GPCR serpentine receptor class x (Srx) domain-containing protein n=1 Tax=Romanomermis culicivorax TaxID=13658 RepID=A0A915IHW0_ROMCU
MINHLIADAICMVPIALYTGMCMIFDTTFSPILERLMSVFVDLGWYPSGLLLITIGITRLISIRFNAHLKRIFNTKINTIILILTWFIYVLITGGYLFPAYITSYLSFDAFTWYYDDQTPYGKFMTIYYSFHGFSTSLTMTIINFIVLALIKRKLSGIDVNVRSNSNKKREIKLFAQCFITGLCAVTSTIPLARPSPYSTNVKNVT